MDRDPRLLAHGRQAVEPIPGAVVPLGHLWTGKLETRGTGDEDCLRWRVGLRLAWDRPRPPRKAIEVLADGIRLTEETASLACDKLLLRVAIEFLPCLHRVRDLAMLEHAFEYFQGSGEQLVDEVEQLWVFGAAAGSAALRVPASHALSTSRTTVETWELATRVVEDGEVAVGTRLRRLLRSMPFLLLSGPAHASGFDDQVSVERSALPALEGSLKRLHDAATRRGRRSVVSLPDEVTDILMDFPGGRHPGQRGERSPVAFAAHLGRSLGLRPCLESDYGLAEDMYKVREHTETWRERQRAGKNATPQMVLLPELGIFEEGMSAGDELEACIVRGLAIALRQPELKQVSAVLKSLKYAQWERSVLLQGWESVEGPLTRVELKIGRDEIGAFARASACGAEMKPIDDGWLVSCWVFGDSVEVVKRRVRATGLEGEVVRVVCSS